MTVGAEDKLELNVREGGVSGHLESAVDTDTVARLFVETCGVGNSLEVGCGEGTLVAGLLKRGVNIHGFDASKNAIKRCNERWPGRFEAGSMLALPYEDNEFQALISINRLEYLSREELVTALEEMWRVTSRYVFIRVSTGISDNNSVPIITEGREWWERCCFDVGFHKHPAYYYVNPYESLNHTGPQIYILLEKMQSSFSVLDAGCLDVLDEEKLLHMDMLREPGRRSDAHCIRYYYAAQYIRPGDVVLDVACGLGYGSHILFNNSHAASVLGVDLSDTSIAYARTAYSNPGRVDFRVGDAQSLDFIEDNSVDFIAAFETIEHVPYPHEYLNALKRVLKPSGRMMICAPNYWADETGEDPNPHHLHVYTWSRLREECASNFLIEKSFLQTAGGAMKCHHSPREWREVDSVEVPEIESEWVLFLCMKDPLQGSNVHYEEVSWHLPKSDNFNVAAFARDYENPWLVKGMVAIGLRLESEQGLVELQKSVMASSDRDTVDYGAALCGYVYGKCTQSFVDKKEYEWLLESIKEYSDISDPNPHQLRWQVSLLFAGGQLARVHGDYEEAVELYKKCANIDVLPYSPLLGNRVLDSFYWLAIMAIGQARYDEARSYLLQSVRACQHLSSGPWINIIGEAESPLAFGLAEMGQLMDKGSRAAYMVAELDNGRYRPKMLMAESSGFLERQLNGLIRERDDIAKGFVALVDRVAEQDKIIRDLNAAIYHVQGLSKYINWVKARIPFGGLRRRVKEQLWRMRKRTSGHRD